jgi:hypothetical protein
MAATQATGDTSVRPFEIHIQDSILEDLKAKLRLRRLPGQSPEHFDPEEDRLCKADNGVPVKETEDLAKYWLEQYVALFDLQVVQSPDLDVDSTGTPKKRE